MVADPALWVGCAWLRTDRLQQSPDAAALHRACQARQAAAERRRRQWRQRRPASCGHRRHLYLNTQTKQNTPHNTRQVVVRCRPLNAQERRDGRECVVDVDAAAGTIRVGETGRGEETRQGGARGTEGKRNRERDTHTQTRSETQLLHLTSHAHPRRNTCAHTRAAAQPQKRRRRQQWRRR